ncbi:23S rRNA (uracil(1939)-C(5))-methyltransferase [Cycloclasticus sp. 46_83_sub15_T18]|nr:23S rRNA (uracil(1939)-C(5))-methyltransferase [Cycloclasticus sp. 46_83_sub15_T18]OUR82938.1 23S rRNA (uracil(1939)-C(5))-methyltransferase [Cycloclasticus sp. 46_120_T64]
MARRRNRRKNLPPETAKATIESMAHDGRGVAHVDDKAVFIAGALPGEEVIFEYSKKKKDFAEGRVTEVLRASADRVEPGCQHYDICGGCSFQHLDPEKQILAKQTILIDQFKSIGKLENIELWPALSGPHWGYRHRARLGVKDVVKKGRVLVGFREKASPYLAEIEQCEVLHSAVGKRLMDLSALIGELSIKDKIPQIEVSICDNRTALVFRILEPLSDNDLDLLKAFEQSAEVDIYSQSKGPDTIKPISGEKPALSYQLPNDVTLYFGPSDFVQVNVEINRKMINRALETLQLNEDDKVLDLFCGLGNFTLPMARVAGQVTGVEGSDDLIKRAKQNADKNGLSNVDFHVANLMEELPNDDWINKKYNKVLIDPPRLGAKEILHYLPKWGAKQVLYISCNPSTLARDAAIMVNELGYTMKKAGVMDMFPHTSHVESIALFEK